MDEWGLVEIVIGTIIGKEVYQKQSRGIRAVEDRFLCIEVPPHSLWAGYRRGGSCPAQVVKGNEVARLGVVERAGLRPLQGETEGAYE